MLSKVLEFRRRRSRSVEAKQQQQTLKNGEHNRYIIHSYRNTLASNINLSKSNSYISLSSNDHHH